MTSKKSKREKGVAGVLIEDDLPLHLHYHGNPPKENPSHPGVFSFPVTPFTSNKWNYIHWIFRDNTEYHTCLKCREKVATGGNNDLSNSIKHIIRNHPELAAWPDLETNNSMAITKYKESLRSNYHSQFLPTSGGATPPTSGGARKDNSLGFPVTSSTKKAKKIATQDMLIRAIALGFLPLNFGKNPGGKVILEWGNGGTLPVGVSPTALTRRMQTLHEKKVSEISNSFTCFKHNETDERPATLSDDEYMTDRLLCLQQDIWSNAAQVVLLA